MRSIRKIGIRILLVAAVLILYENLVEFVYRPYHEIVIRQNQEREEMNGTIEILLCGTSTAQRGFDPQVIDEALQTKSFNIGTSLQPLDGTYHLIKDMAESNPVETVFLTMAPDTMKREVVATKYKGYVYDRLDGLGNKINYLLQSCDIDEWPYVTLYSVRTEEYFDVQAIKENIHTKRLGDYESGAYCNANYRGQGFMSLSKSYKGTEKASTKKTKFSANSIYEGNVTWLEKIVTYCNKQGIELILVYAPLTEDEIGEYQDFSSVHNYYKALAEEYNVEFWDFNYYKGMEQLFTNKQFQDKKHLNVKGAALFSGELAKVYNAYHMGEDVSELFLEQCPYSKE